MRNRNSKMYVIFSGAGVVAVSLIIAFAVGYFSNNKSYSSSCVFNGTYYEGYNVTAPSSFTVSVYASFIGPGVLVSQGIKNNSHSEWYLGIGGETHGKLGFGVFSNYPGPDNTTEGWRFADANISYGKWYHIIGVYGSDSLKLYINGALVSVEAAPFPAINGSHVIFVGRRTSGFYTSRNGTASFEYFDGRIEDLEVFNTSFNQSQVDTLFKVGSIQQKPVLQVCADASRG